MRQFYVIVVGLLLHLCCEGQDWQRVQLLLTPADLPNAQVFNDTAIVISERGAIVYTTDFFQTFFVDSSRQPTHVLASIAFSNRETGYICDPYSRGGLLKTTDGGLSWNALSTGITQGSNWGSLLVFANNDTAYNALVHDNIIYYTYDSGITWNAKTVSSGNSQQIVRIRVINDSVIYVLSNDFNIPGIYYGHLHLFRSTNYGTTWIETYDLDDRSPGDFVFIDDTTIILTASHLILKSQDAGFTFDTVMLGGNSYPDLVSFPGNRISFLSHDTGYAAFDVYVYKTYDAGNTWMRTNFYYTGVASRNNFIYAIPPQKVIIGCPQGEVYVTTNGGGVWTGEKQMPPDALNFNLYPNPATNYALITFNQALNGAMLEVDDALGKAVHKQTITGTEVKLNTANYQSGMYFVKVTTSDGNTGLKKLVLK